MAESPSSSIKLESIPVESESEKTNVTPQSPPLLPELQQLPPQNPQTTLNPPSISPPISPSPSFPFYVSPSSGAVAPLSAPSFHTVPLPAPPQFSIVPNYDDPDVQPPGVSPPQSKMSGGYYTGAVLVVPLMLYQVPPGVSSAQSMTSGGYTYKAGAVLVKPPVLYHVPPSQPPQPSILQYDPLLDGYAAMPHPGLLHYPSPCTPMVPPAFAPYPSGAIGPIPPVPHPFVPGPAILPSITPEKPQTRVYVGKIPATVENGFMLNLLQLCGPVKSWKRANDPINGTPMAFGFCEFATAEGVLRALRLLNKFNINGQELVVNVNQSTREYLERYVEKFEDWKKLKETEDAGAEKEDRNASGAEKSQDTASFGIVTDADREIDRLVSEKLPSKTEERLREIQRYEEEEEEVERIRKETEQRRKAKCEYANRLKEWECIESRREKQWQYEKEREMDRELKREREIFEEEDSDGDDDDRKRGRRSEQEGKRKRRLRELELENDLADRQREEEEIAERREKRNRRLREMEDDLADRQREEEEIAEKVEKRMRRLREIEDDLADRQKEEEEIAESNKRAEEELKKQKVRFGLVGSRKKTPVPFVFHEDDDGDEAQKSKRVRPNCTKDDAKDKVLGLKMEHDLEKAKTQDNKKHLDAKQLIDMIPKTKEELFSYEINWDVYDKHELHEMMRPWISKKIVEFMGDEEPTLVDYIVSTTQQHMKASEMFELLLPTLDEETEMFVLKMWVLLIFEIKKVETGLSMRT